MITLLHVAAQLLVDLKFNATHFLRQNQEFDLYDEDNSGFIDLNELRELLEKLGEDLSEDELQQAFKELDQDSSGEIEFFEFVEWFTSEE